MQCLQKTLQLVTKFSCFHFIHGLMVWKPSIRFQGLIILWPIELWYNLSMFTGQRNKKAIHAQNVSRHIFVTILFPSWSWLSVVAEPKKVSDLGFLLRWYSNFPPRHCCHPVWLGIEVFFSSAVDVRTLCGSHIERLQRLTSRRSFPDAPPLARFPQTLTSSYWTLAASPQPINAVWHLFPGQLRRSYAAKGPYQHHPPPCNAKRRFRFSKPYVCIHSWLLWQTSPLRCSTYANEEITELF